jgi:hypothetical protein
VTVVGGTIDLKIFTGPPQLAGAGFDPPDGIVGGKYSYPMPMNPDPALAATSFTAKNLPTGVKIDPKSGLIEGFPTKAGTFRVTVTAGNAINKVTTSEAEVIIAAFPDNLAGTYAGLVERDDGLNLNMGGRFDGVVTITGAFTGSITLGTSKLPLKGQLDVAQTPPRATVVVKRAGGLRDLVVSFEVENNAIAGNSQVNDGPSAGNIAPITGWRQIWSATAKPGIPANPATEYQTYYTLGLKLAGGPDTLPQGWGYGSFKIAADGKLILAGKTADGEPITCGAFIGPNGEVPVYQPLYMTIPKGSILGVFTVAKGATAAATDNTIGGLLDWVRPLDTKATARTYEAGFGNTGMPVEVDVLGSAYGPITGDTIVMGLFAAVDNVEVTFEDGGIDLSSGPNPNLIFDLGAKNKITVPKAGVDNPGAVTFTLVPGTGFFSGSFTLIDDPNPRPPPAVLKRTVKFQGFIINDGTEEHGVGYALVPQLGEPAPSTVTNLNSDILSGSVDFHPTPVGP